MWKEYLIDAGLTYSEAKDEYTKSIGWGRTLSVSMIMKGLFEIKKGEEVLFSDFVQSFNQFKELINKHIK